MEQLAASLQTSVDQRSKTAQACVGETHTSGETRAFGFLRANAARAANTPERSDKLVSVTYREANQDLTTKAGYKDRNSSRDIRAFVKESTYTSPVPNGCLTRSECPSCK